MHNIFVKTKNKYTIYLLKQKTNTQYKFWNKKYKIYLLKQKNKYTIYLIQKTNTQYIC